LGTPVQIAGVRLLVVGVGIGAGASTREVARRVHDGRRRRGCRSGSRLGGVDASLVFSAKKAGFRLGFDLLNSGLFVGVSLPRRVRAIEFNPFELFGRTRRHHSAVGTVQDGGSSST
jgi:hypothetical protein